MVAEKTQIKKNKKTTKLIPRSGIRKLLHRDGRRDEITASAFHLLSTLGTDIVCRLINTGKQQMMHTLGDKGLKVTINKEAMAHAANCLNITGDVTEEAMSSMLSMSFDKKSFRRSATKRLVQRHGGKKRTRADVPSFLFCIAMIIVDEIVSQIQQNKGNRNVRIKNEHVFNAIKSDSKVLAPLKSFIGQGMSFC